MRKKIKKTAFAATTIALLFTTGSTIAAAAPAPANLHDAEAEALLQKMSDYMASLESMSADLYVFDEQIMGDGFKLSVLRSGKVKMQRPNKIYISRKGTVRDQEFFFNGTNLVIYGKNIGMAIDLPVRGNLDRALDAASNSLGEELTGRDLFSQDIATPLLKAITESATLGVNTIGNATCRQLVFRTDEVDMQLWVQEGDHPLPCRYTITEKWTYAAPQYTVTFNNWQVNQKFPDSDFNFTAPAGVTKTTVNAFKNALQQEEGKR